MNKEYDLFDLKGISLNNAIKNMQEQLLSDFNDIKTLNDITLDRIISEIDALNLKFNRKGDIIC